MTRCKTFFKFAGALALLTAPFVWLVLQPDFTEGTVQAAWSWKHGFEFLYGFWPGLAVAAGVWVLWRLFVFCRPKVQPLPLKIPNVFKRSDVRWGGLLLFFGVMTFFGGAKFLSLATFMGIYMMMALGLNIAVGMAGLLVLGYAGFFILGAYSFAVAQKFLPWTQWWMTLIPVFLLGLGVGWLVGLPCLKLRGDYLAIVTLGFAEGIRELVRNISPVTGGDKGLSIAFDAQFQSWGFLSAQQTAYLTVLAGVALTALTIHRIYHSRIGRAWIAIREDELAAGATGVPVVRMKLLAFALSSGFGAVAGVLYTAYVGFIDPVAGALEQSILVLAMVILGGMGSIPGVMLGSALLYLFPALLRDWVPQLADYRLFFFGALMVAMMLYRPQGLMGSRRRRHELEGEGMKTEAQT